MPAASTRRGLPASSADSASSGVHSQVSNRAPDWSTPVPSRYTRVAPR